MRGLRDFAEDVIAFMNALDVESAPFIGWSTGGGVVLRRAIDYMNRVDAIGLTNPVSSYGYSETIRDGTPCQQDYAGSGARLTDEDCPVHQVHGPQC